MILWGRPFVAWNAARDIYAISLVARALEYADSVDSMNDRIEHLTAGLHLISELTDAIWLRLDAAAGADAHQVDADSPKRQGGSR